MRTGHSEPTEEASRRIETGNRARQTVQRWYGGHDRRDAAQIHQTGQLRRLNGRNAQFSRGSRRNDPTLSSSATAGGTWRPSA